MAKPTKSDSTTADAMASTLFSSFTQPAARQPATVPAAAASSPALPRPALTSRPQPEERLTDAVESPAVAAPVLTTGPTRGTSRAEVPRRNRATPEAKRRRETVILSEAERRPIVTVAEHMAATKPGASFSEAARFLLAIGEHVLTARPDAYATLERTPPAGWAALARALAANPTPEGEPVLGSAARHGRVR